MNDRQTMTVNFQVTDAQALALGEFFGFWNQLASMGSSRYVAFFVDGDGNFKPKCEITHSEAVPDIDASCAKVEPKSASPDTHYFDFDPVAWKLGK